MANNIANQTKNAQVNSFTGGLNTDLHPLLQPNDTLTDCVNGTLITYDGNENMLQNDMGNYALKGAKLPINYVPIGMKEYAGILYVVAYNPVDRRVQLGSYPSPKTHDPHESPQAEVEIKPFVINGEVEDDFNPMEILRQIESGNLDNEHYLYSSILNSANQMIAVLGSEENSSYYLTVNDQFQLEISSSEGSDVADPWNNVLQKLKFFAISENGTIEDITESAKEYSNKDTFQNVPWQSPGWIGVKYELAKIERSAQYVSNVIYPKYTRLGHISWVEKESSKVTGLLNAGRSFYDEPYLLLPTDGDEFEKCYWKNKIPHDSETNTVVYYSDAVWNVNDRVEYTCSENGNWKTVKFKTSVGDIWDLFAEFHGQYLYVFLPKLAKFTSLENFKCNSLGVIISETNTNEFVVDRDLHFLNIPNGSSTFTIKSFIKELYCPEYNKNLTFENNTPKVHTVYGNLSNEGFAAINWINIVADSPRTEDVEPTPEPEPEEESYWTISYSGNLDGHNLDSTFSDKYEIVQDGEAGQIRIFTTTSHIPENTFKGCKGLKTITIPDHITHVDKGAFSGCTSLECVTVLSSIYVGSEAFKDCTGELKLQSEGSISFSDALNDAKFTKLTINKTSGNIYRPSIFSRLSCLREIEINSNSCEIEWGVFSGSETLQKLVISTTSRITLEEECFANCENLKEVVLQSQSTDIYVSTFKGCTSLPCINNIYVIDGGIAVGVKEDATEFKLSDGIKKVVSKLFDHVKDGSTIIIDTDVYLYLGNNHNLAECVITDRVSEFNWYDDDMSKFKTIKLYTHSIPSGIDKWNKVGSDTELYVYEELFDGWKQLNNAPTDAQLKSLGKLSDLNITTTFEYTTSDGNSMNVPLNWAVKSHEYGRLEVYGRIKAMPAYTTNVSRVTKLVIPEGIVSICNYCYLYNVDYNCDIYLPSTLKFIGYNTFAGEASLETIQPNVYIPNLEMWCDIDFADHTSNPCNDGGSLYIGNTEITGGELVIPDIDRIKKYAFYGMVFDSVIIPDSVTSIDERAFYRGHINKLTIGNGIKYLGTGAFDVWSQFEQINIPSIEYWMNIDFETEESNPISRLSPSGLIYSDNILQDGVFTIPENIHELKKHSLLGINLGEELTIPNNITTLGDGAFKNNTTLKKLIIPSSVTFIGSKVCSKCTSLETVELDCTISYIPFNMFEGCTSLTAVTIPNSVTSIRSYAFQDCSSLTSVTIPDSVTSIGSDSFRYCDALTTINIPNSVVEIGSNVFETKSTIESTVNIPKNVTKVGWRAFSNRCGKIIIDSKSVCKDLAEEYSFISGSKFSKYIFGENVDKLPEGTLNGNENVTSIEFKHAINSSDKEIFKDCANLKEVVVSDIKIWLDSDIIFSSFTNGCELKVEGETVTTVTIPDGHIIGQSFRGYTKLETLIIGDNINSIPDRAFQGCSNLESLSLGKDVRTIGTSAFMYTNISTIELPSSVVKVGNYAFSNITEIHINNMRRWMDIDLSNSSFGTNSRSLYLCDIEQNNIIIPEGVTTIDWYSFSKIKANRISIPDSVTSIGSSAFEGCTVDTIVVGRGVKSIGGQAFNNMTSNSDNPPKLYFKTKSEFSNISKIFSQSICDVYVYEDVHEYWKNNKYSYDKYTLYKMSNPILTESARVKLLGNFGTLKPSVADGVQYENVGGEITIYSQRADWFTGGNTEYEYSAYLYDPAELLPGTCETLFVDQYSLDNSPVVYNAKLLVVLENMYDVNISNDSSIEKLCVYGKHCFKSSPFRSDANYALYVDNVSNMISSTYESGIFGPNINLYLDGKYCTDLTIPKNSTIMPNALSKLYVDKLNILEGCTIKSNAVTVKADNIQIDTNVVVEEEGITVLSESKLTSYSDITNIAFQPNVTVEVIPEYWIPEYICVGVKGQTGSVTPMWRQIYLSGKDSANILTDNGCIKTINDSDRFKYVFPQSWKYRGVSSDRMFYTTDQSEYKHPYQKYGHDVIRKITDKSERNVSCTIGWKVDGNKISIFNVEGVDWTKYTFWLNLFINGSSLDFPAQPIKTSNTTDTTSSVYWNRIDTLGDISYLTYTADNMTFRINSTLRVKKSEWTDSSIKNVRCAATIIGTDSVGRKYAADIHEDIELSCTSLGNFYELGYRYTFVDTIPETFIKLDISSVFYYKEDDGVAVIFDQTLQKDSLLIPEYALPDYSNVEARGAHYDVGELVDNKRTLKFSFETNDYIESGIVLCTLSDFSGRYTTTTVGFGGMQTEHSFEFKDIPKNVQLCEICAELNGESLLKGTAILHTKVNNYAEKDDMFTISPEFIINQILAEGEDDEWPLSLEFVCYDNEVSTMYGRYNTILENNDIIERDRPSAKEIAIVDKNGVIPNISSNLADIHRMPVKLNLKLGGGIQLTGCVSNYKTKFSDGINTITMINKDGDFRLNEKTGGFLSAICKFSLEPDMNKEKTTKLPIKTRLLKYFYRPLEFDNIMTSLGFSEDDIRVFDEYWERNYGLIGHRYDNSLEYERRHVCSFDQSTSNFESLHMASEKLPVVIPIHFKNEDSEGWYGINMPTALKGISTFKTSTWCNTDRYDNALMKHYRAWKRVDTTIDNPTTSDIVSLANKTKDIWAFLVNTADTSNPIRYTWFYDCALWPKDKFSVVEKWLFLAGLAISKDDGMEIASDEDLFFVKEPTMDNYTKYVISNVSGKCSSTQYQYYGKCGELFNFEFSTDVSVNLKLPTKYLNYFRSEIKRYEASKENVFENSYLNALKEQLSEDWRTLKVPEPSTEVTPRTLKLRRSVFDRRDGKTGPTNYSTKYFWSDSDKCINAQDGYHVVHIPSDNPTHMWWDFGEHKLESLERKTDGKNKSPKGDSSGSIPPWPIRSENNVNDIFCQIFKEDATKFVNSDEKITINGKTATIDYWLTFYLREIIKEIKYETEYRKAED